MNMEDKKEMWAGHEHCHGGKHHLVKMILKLVIIILIFWCGFKLGEITGSIRYGRGMENRNDFRMMQGYNYSNNIPNTNGVVVPTPAKQ